MKLLGITQLVISNASGGVNPDIEGDLMVLNDHINLIPSPLIGPNMSSFSPRFPDMSETYDKKLVDKAMEIGKKHGYRIFEGVYAAVTESMLRETPAEYKYVRIIGADTVGMSTVPEAIVARHMDLPCFAISVITDLGVEGKYKR